MDPAQFAADLAWATNELRSHANARMEWLSRARILRATGNLTQDAEGFDVPEYATIYADLPCRIDSGGSSDGGSSGVEVGGVNYEEATGLAHFPHPSELLANDDIVLITSGDWPDACYRIVAAIAYDQKTARRLPIKQEPKPEGVA